MFTRTDEVKKDAIGQPLDFFLKKYSGQTTDAALKKAYHSIRESNNTWVMPIAEQLKISAPIIAAKAAEIAKSTKSQKPETTGAQIATSTSEAAPKGAKSARIAALAIEGKTIKEVMTIMAAEGLPIVYSQAHQIFKKLNPK